MGQRYTLILNFGLFPNLKERFLFGNSAAITGWLLLLWKEQIHFGQLHVTK